jgi:chemotaxis protein methyltransferase CheR
MLSPTPRHRAPAVTGVFASLLESRTGQQLDANREWRIETALKPVLRERGLESLDQLAGELLAARDKTIGNQIIDALLNQETSFFRDAAVLDMVAQAVAAVQTPELNRRVRIWSAGCSSGQEPLSLAMLFAEQPGGEDKIPEIVATDISDASVARGRAGRFAPAMRRHVFARLAEVLRPGGLLVLGAGETVIGQTDAFRPSPTYRGLYEPSGLTDRSSAAA